MVDMRAYCGENCAECPVYIATVTNDQKLREETARERSQAFSAEIKPEDLHCLGCKSASPLALSAPRCPVRRCNLDKGLVHCGDCPDYPCGPFNRMFGKESPGREFLDCLRTRSV